MPFTPLRPQSRPREEGRPILQPALVGRPRGDLGGGDRERGAGERGQKATERPGDDHRGGGATIPRRKGKRPRERPEGGKQGLPGPRGSRKSRGAMADSGDISPPSFRRSGRASGEAAGAGRSERAPGVWGAQTRARELGPRGALWRRRAGRRRGCGRPPQVAPRDAILDRPGASKRAAGGKAGRAGAPAEASHLRAGGGGFGLRSRRRPAELPQRFPPSPNPLGYSCSSAAPPETAALQPISARLLTSMRLALARPVALATLKGQRPRVLRRRSLKDPRPSSA